MKRPDKRPDTWMPLYVADYLRDTGHLTAAEHGAYLLLIMQAWTRGGSLPTAVERLRLMCHLDREDWETVRDAVLPFFYIKDDCYRHRRVDRELNGATFNIEQRRTAGLASAEARRKQRDSTERSTEGQRPFNEIGNDRSTELATEPPTNTPTEGQRNGRPSPSPIKKDSDLRSGVKAPDARVILWERGLPIIRSLVGQSDSQARGFLGKMLKVSHDDCARVLQVILEAQSLNPANPAAWLLKAATPREERGLLDHDPPPPSPANPTGRRITEIVPY